MNILSRMRQLLTPSKPGGFGDPTVTDKEATDWAENRRQLEQQLIARGTPRIALVKQDVCEDLYCCPAGSDTATLIESTMLRTGPVALFTRCHADFHIARTLTEPECEIWKERALDLKWESLDFFSSFQRQIPGRDYGQSRDAVNPEDVDWSVYDIVISVDISIPARVTRRFPKTLWAYYVREVKAPSYRRSYQELLPGQDLFLSQSFRRDVPRTEPEHIIEFPYHLQYVGWFHELFGGEIDKSRHGVFVDHHTALQMSPAESARLLEFGPVSMPINEASTAASRQQSLPYRRTMDPELRERLMTSRYFVITPGQRNVFGTAMVEAIAAGCLAIGSPRNIATHGFFFTPATTANSLDDAIKRIRHLDTNRLAYQYELTRQRCLVDWLCYTRPLQQLLSRLKSDSGSKSSLVRD